MGLLFIPAWLRIGYSSDRNKLALQILRDTDGDGNLNDNDTTTLIESSVAVCPYWSRFN